MGKSPGTPAQWYKVTVAAGKMLFIICRLHNTRDFSVTPETTGTQTMSDCDWSEVHKSQTIRHRLAVRQCTFGYCAREPEERPEEGKETEMWGQTGHSLRSTWDEMALLLWESLGFYASVKPLVLGLTVTLSALSNPFWWKQLLNVTHFYFAGCLHSWGSEQRL